MAAYEDFANTPTTTVRSGGTDAPAEGTVETWTVATSSGFPAAATGSSQFHVADTATGDSTEMIAVTNVSGSTWTVTRGAESTATVAHMAGFTIVQVVTAGGYGSFAQTGQGDLGGSGNAPTVAKIQGTAIASPPGGTTEYLRGDGNWAVPAGGGGGGGSVSSVTAADTSIVIGGTGANPTVATGTLDVIAADHPPAANWSNNSHRITSLANGTASTDAAAFGQIPVSAGSIGGLLAANNLSDVASRQTSLNNLAGAVTAGDYLRGTGSNIAVSSIQAADVPVLNQNTTGTASNITATLDQVPAPAANVSLNNHKITSLANGASSSDGAAIGQTVTGILTTLGDTVYENATPAPARLAGNTTATKNFLTQTGTGSASAPPIWGTIASGDMPTGTTGAKGALQLDGTASDIQNTGPTAAGNSGLAADAKHVHFCSGMYLATPTTYAPGTVTALSVAGTVLTALSSGNVNTGQFTAPSSTTVVVTVSMVAEVTASSAMAFGLSAHGTASSIFGNLAVFNDGSANTPRAYCIPFVVTGLVANTPYNFDLVATAPGTVSVLALGEQNPGTVTGTFRGAPVTMTVQAV